MFGEVLVLRAGGAAATSFALPLDNNPPLVGPAPIGPAASLTSGFQAGLRIGAGFTVNPIADWHATYTFVELRDDSVSPNPGGGFIQALVVHPATLAADTQFTSASATGRVDLDLGDVDYRRVFGDCWQTHAYVLGGRYAHLRQTFDAVFTNAANENVRSQVNFEGGGMRIGFDSEWLSKVLGLSLYGHGIANIVAGQFNASYAQTNSLAGTVVETSWSANRIVPILEFEMGGAWLSPDGRWRVNVGYMFSAWLNAVNNQDFIRGVQTSLLDGMGDTVTFDGLVAGLEYRR